MDQSLSQPIDGPRARIATLDILRGIAILGILFMNINVMGGPISVAHSSQPNLIGWTTPDQLAWALREVLASGTARCLLQMLFGAGMMILTDRLADGTARWNTVTRYYWRNIVLAAFGLIHVWLLLWPGDVLHIYAASALLAFPLRRLHPRWLILLGLSFAAYSAVMSGIGMTKAIRNNAAVAEALRHQSQGLALTAAEKKEIASLEEWHDEMKQVRVKAAEEITLRRSGLAGWAKVMIGEWVGRYSRWRSVLGMYWESLSVILIGAALFKLGIIQGTRSRRFYLRMMIAGYAVGLPIRLIGMIVAFRVDDAVTYAWAASEFTRIATTVGHLGLICWLLTSPTTARLFKPFVAAGRAALSIYIAQTIICLWLLYPPFALGLFGKQGWMALMLTALAVNAGLLMFANWYMRRFEIAPVEWIWRSLAARRRLPFSHFRVMEPRQP